MESGDYQIINRHCLNLIKLLPKNKKNKLTSSLLIALTAFIPLGIALQPNSTLAQDRIAQSLSVDKNVIYVNPNSGDDSQTGEKTSPLKTITQALKIAPADTTIKLASGTYSEETGETFPLIVKNNISLQGNSRNQGYKTIIKGGGDFSSPTGAGQNIAIAALRDAGGITGVTVTNEHSRGHGLWIESSSPNIVSNTFTRNGNTGVSVNGNSSPLIENNYFYNNSGNGLLVYGTSQPQVIENTFEQTGFGVSAVQNTDSTLTSNYFDSNRIGIILEGDSKAILRDNEIVNSNESGLTAIANSHVDLGTNDEAGDNIFRSNKIDIQNATSNEITAVGTETNGEVVGKINLEGGEIIAETEPEPDLPPLLPPSNNNNPPPKSNLPPATPTQTSSLPSPPPVSVTETSNKELVFTAPSASASEASPEPVPFVPQTSNSALNSNSSQISSLSDVLGSSAASVKYKVLVEAEDEYAQQEVRSLYPQAFATVYQGRSVLQVGAFNNWDKAKQAMRSLSNLGLDTHILE